jgi:hypothetical protein
VASSNIVQPARPHAPFAGTKAPLADSHSRCCTAGGTLTIARAPSGCSDANTRPWARKSGWS